MARATAGERSSGGQALEGEGVFRGGQGAAVGEGRLPSAYRTAGDAAAARPHPAQRAAAPASVRELHQRGVPLALALPRAVRKKPTILFC